MTHTEQVVAVLEREEDEQVVDAAQALARALGAEVAVLRPHGGDAAGEVLRSLAGEQVVGAVLSAHGEHAVLWEVVTRATVPILVIPRDLTGTLESVDRVVVPLDGSAATAAVVAPMIRAVLAAGADVVAVHVFAPATAPAFWDHAGHSHVAFTEEFLRRHQLEGVRLDLRRGRPVVELLDTLDRSHADLVLLGWSQDLSAGHADVVRRALVSAAVPVLLVGAGPGPLPDQDTGPSALPPSPG